MSMIYIFRLTHFVGIVLWAGSVITVTLGATLHPQTPASIWREVIRLVATPGMIAAWLGGLGMLIPHFTELYARAGWMHTKLLLVVVLSALHGITISKLRKAEETGIQAKTMNRLFLATSALVIAIVTLAVLKPGF